MTGNFSGRNSQTSIRPATAKDADAIASFIAMAEAEMLHFITGANNPEAAREILAGFVLDPRPNRYSFEHVLMAELDGEPAGSILCFPADRQPELDAVILEALHSRGIRLPRLFFEGVPGTFYLSAMGVAPDRRRKGIGGALMAAAEERGRRLGFSRASLIVSAGKPKARELYERRGYRIIEDVAIADIPYHRMALELGA